MNAKLCKWIKERAIKCRFPEEVEKHGEVTRQLFCIACLFGWHLELSELKTEERGDNHG